LSRVSPLPFGLEIGFVASEGTRREPLSSRTSRLEARLLDLLALRFGDFLLELPFPAARFRAISANFFRAANCAGLGFFDDFALEAMRLRLQLRTGNVY